MGMVDLRYKDGRDGGPLALWRESATPDERSEVKKIDAAIDKLEKERRKLSQQRYTITNRCAVRTLARRKGMKNGKG